MKTPAGTALRLHQAEDIPILPTQEVTRESIQTLRGVAAISAHLQDLTPHREIPLHPGHRVPVILLPHVPLLLRHVQVVTQAAVAVVAEGDNNLLKENIFKGIELKTSSEFINFMVL